MCKKFPQKERTKQLQTKAHSAGSWSHAWKNVKMAEVNQKKVQIKKPDSWNLKITLHFPLLSAFKKSDGPINIVKVLDLLFLDRLQDFDDLPGGELWHKREAPTYWDVRWSNGPFAAKPRTSCWWVRGIQWTLRLTKLHKHARSDQRTASMSQRVDNYNCLSLHAKDPKTHWT